MDTRFYLLVVIAWTAPVVEAQEPCPPDFWHIAGFCIFTVTQPVLNTWKEAYEACQSRFGSTIAMINSNFLWVAISKEGSSQLNIAPGGIWMGLNYTFATNKYQWMDGTEMLPDSDWTLWAPGQPITADKDKCVILEKTYVIKKRFGWSLVDCDDPNTTGVAICLMMEGTWTLGNDGGSGGSGSGSVGNGEARGQAPQGTTWSLFMSAAMLLLGIRRAWW